MATTHNYILVFLGRIVSPVIVIFAILLIMFFLNVNFDARKREMGILRGLGASSKDIKLIFLSESFMLVLIALIPAFLGTIITCIVINTVTRVIVFIFGIIPIVSLLALSLGVGFIASLLTMRTIKNKKLIDIIRNE